MDFPIDLTKREFVTGYEEFRQTFTLLFSNMLKTFMQSEALGSLVSPHIPKSALEMCVNETVKQMPGTTLEDLSVVNSTSDECTISILVKYKDEIAKFTFSV